MTALDTNDDDDKKSTTPDYVERAADGLRAEADAVAAAAYELAEAIEAGDADPEQVDETLRLWATLLAPIQDTADLGGVIDPQAERYRTIESAQKTICRAAARMDSDGDE